MMRKQNHKPVVNEFAIKINELIEKFVEKVGQAFQLMINEELIEKTRRYFGLDSKKPVVRETTKPARLTKPKRTKKRVTAPAEPLVVKQSNPKPPAIETPKLDWKTRRKLIKQLTRTNATQKALRVKNLIKGGRKDRNGKKRHIPHVILKKRDVQQEQPLNKPAEPVLIVNQFVELPVFDPSNPSVVGSVKIQLSQDELNSILLPKLSDE